MVPLQIGGSIAKPVDRIVLQAAGSFLWGIPFYKWFRDRKKTVVPVNVMGMDEDEKRKEILETPEGPSAKSPQVSTPIQSVSLILESGVQITKNNLSYRELEELIGKLEVLF